MSQHTPSPSMFAQPQRGQSVQINQQGSEGCAVRHADQCGERGSAAPRKVHGEGCREAVDEPHDCWMCGDECDCASHECIGCVACRDFFAAKMGRASIPTLDRDTFHVLAALYEMVALLGDAGGAR